jgi:hypothetical protein
METLEGRLVTVTQISPVVTEDTEFEIHNKFSGKTWYIDSNGAGSTPEKYWDTSIEDEARKLVKQLYKSLTS